MAGSINAGSVIYEVDIDTSRLIQGRREIDAALSGLNGSMGRLEASVTRTERSIGNMQRTMSSLSNVARGLLAALSVQQVASYADAWTELNNKVSNSVRSGEQQSEVMQRIFDVSQATQSSLNGTATLYARLERGTRTYNTSAEDLVKLTTIINQGFAVSGATAQEAENAIIQLSQGIASGVLRGEEFNSVSEQGSRLTVALADSLGVTLGQLRAMAAQGKLTTDVIVKGLLSQGEVIGKEFEKTTVTISKGLQVAGNNVTKFFGENATVKSFAMGFRDSVISMSENLDKLGLALYGVATIIGSRYAGALAMATADKVKKAIASREETLAEARSTKATYDKSTAELRAASIAKERALDEVRLAEMMKLSSTTASGSAAAEQRLSAARVEAATLTNNYNAALAANTAAQEAARAAADRAAITVRTLATRALGLIGGPVGVAVIAASAIMYFTQKSKEAREEANKLADSVNELGNKFQKMSNTELAATIGKLSENLPELGDAVADAKKDFDSATASVRLQQREIEKYGTNTTRGRQAAEALSGAQDRLAVATYNLEEAQRRYDQTQSAINIGRATLNGTMRQGIDLLRRDGQEVGVVAGMMNQLGNAINFSTRAKEKFNSTSLMVERPKDIQDYLDGQEDQIELQGELNDRKRAQLKAEKEIRALAKKAQSTPEETENYVRTARERAGAEYDATKALSDRKKADKSAASEAKKSANAAESDAQKLQRLKEASEQSAESTEELSRAQAILNAQNSLSKNASADMIRQAGEYAATKWDTANALKAQAAAEKLLPETKENASYRQDMKDLRTALDGKKITQKEYDRTAERLEEQHQVNLAKIRAEGVVSPTAQAKGEVDPVQQLANQHAQELAMIQQFETQKGQITQRGLELMNAANQHYEQQRIAAQWEIWRQQGTGYEVAAAAFDSFAGNASNALTGIITGSMTVSEAMRSLGSTVLNSVINSFVQMGVEWAKSVIMGQVGMSAASAATIAQGQLISASMAPAAAMTSLATAGANAVPAQAGIASTVGVAQALSIAGMRKNGGPVTAGSMYQVGEGGMPEIYQSNSGKQYMIPGDNGSVISNKDMQSGTVQVNVKFYDQTSGGQHSFEAQAMQDGGVVTVEGFLNDIDRGGPMSSGMQQHFGLSRKANGDF
ncbi:MAG: tape measure protein [Enterobacteriaceae bacterium]|nr:tape measure protein [Enterobacteriaceae bacterium]